MTDFFFQNPYFLQFIMVSVKYDVTTLSDPHHHFIKRWLNFTSSQPLPALFTEVEHFYNLLYEWHIYTTAKIFLKQGIITAYQSSF